MLRPHLSKEVFFVTILNSPENCVALRVVIEVVRVSARGTSNVTQVCFRTVPVVTIRASARWGVPVVLYESPLTERAFLCAVHAADDVSLDGATSFLFKSSQYLVVFG